MMHEVYCDESRQEYFYNPVADRDCFTLIGGLWIQADKREQYKVSIRRLRAVHDVWGEFKWNRVSPSRLEFYVALVRLFFQESMRFRCIVLPVHHLDATVFHNADNELMFYKFYYQLLVHWIEYCNTYRIFVDLKTNRLSNRIRTLERVLRNAKPDAHIASVQALPSRQVDLLQLADVLTGAVGYRFHEGSTSAAKLTIVQEIENLLGHSIGPTPPFEQKFNVFRFEPFKRE